MANIVNKIVNVGRIECSRDNATPSLFVTITDTTSTRPPYKTVRLLPKQSSTVNQTWCLAMVKTKTMQECFIICSHPTMDKVLVATNDPVEGYINSKYIRVQELETPIVEGKPLPPEITSNKTELYQFRVDPAETSPRGGYYLCSLSNIFHDTVIQGGFQTTDASKNAPNVNDVVNIHDRQRIMREWFWFDNDPTRP